MPDSAKLAQRILGERDRRLAERVHEIVLKDRHGASIVLGTGKVSLYWGWDVWDCTRFVAS